MSATTIKGLVERGANFFRRCEQTLRDKTISHVTGRWVVFILLLGIFILRALVYLQEFFLVAYGLAIYFIAQCTNFWNPFNEILARPSNNNNNVHNSTDNNDDELNAPLLQPPPLPRRRRRRISEYQAWLISCRGVLVAILCTFVPWLDVPVYWPVLLSFAIFLAVVEGVRLIWRRWAVDTQEDTSENHHNAVQIRLVTTSPFSSSFLPSFTYAITNMTPWSAARRPPSFLHCTTTSPEEWRTFLLDLDAAMETDGRFNQRVCTLLGIFGALAFAGIVAFHHLQRFPRLQCTDDALWTCPRFILVILMAYGPAVLYYILSLRWLVTRKTEELTRLAERVQRICDDFRGQHPNLCCHVKAHGSKFITVTVQHHATQV